MALLADGVDARGVARVMRHPAGAILRFGNLTPAPESPSDEGEQEGAIATPPFLCPRRAGGEGPG